ncbi:hypothetical protein MAM1_0098d05156 [Mucor ambiguus]|uniref:Extracellular membrane protein CFEM domain-containing protein n=1 Tax=Mucor ambiguus TaxID=91626 RepID=A0A0C9MQW8_9FUNG|nr:hypothetical protein MAM1_0098d05156 [Mucor ambiguus]
MKLFLVLKTTLLVCAIQLVHGRCVCDPADTTCLNDCECINVHWPGATFEDDELEEAEAPNTSIQKQDDATTALIATTTEVDFIGALISAIFNPSNAQETTLPTPALKTEISDAASVLMPTSDAGPLLPLSEIASMLNITDPLLTTSMCMLMLQSNKMKPYIKLYLAHTTITSMVTVTPTAAPSISSGTDASVSSSSSASFGSGLQTSLFYPMLIFVLTLVFIH